MADKVINNAATKVVAQVLNSIDDTSTVNTDIDKLYHAVIRKIDLVRSPADAKGLGTTPDQTRTGQDELQNELELTATAVREGQEINSQRHRESRVHALYRVLGLPIVASDGTLRNVGYNPRNSQQNAFLAVDRKVQANEALQRLTSKRETDAEDRRKLFVNRDINSTAYALMTRYIKPFLMIDKSNTNPFFNDSQSMTPAARRNGLVQFELRTANQSISDAATNLIINPCHVLKPFAVDPTIEQSVPLAQRVCVPFLSDSDRVADPILPALPRPAIEYIIRRRLLDQVQTESAAQAGVENIGQIFAGINVAEFTLTQSAVVERFVRNIKGILHRLNQDLRNIDLLSQKSFWQPVPDQNGPEFGGVTKVGGDGSSVSELTHRIAQLQLAQLAQQQTAVPTRDYTLTLDADDQKDYGAEISKLERQRDRVSTDGINLLREVEIITGEVSGLGLIDVYAIHTALWAIDIEYLLAFLDGNASERMWNFNRDFRGNTQVLAQYRGNGKSVTEALQVFEAQLVNVLSFADEEVKRDRKNPRRVPSSNI